MGHSRRFDRAPITSGLPYKQTFQSLSACLKDANFGSNRALTQCMVRRNYRGLSFGRQRVDT